MDIDVAVVGSLNRDLTVITSQHPLPGETVLGTRHYWDNGGKGANQAVAAARLGARVALVGRVGDDVGGRLLREALGEENIDTSGVGTDADLPTGLAVITIDSTAENTIVVSPGANSRLSPTHVRNQSDVIAAARVLLVQLEVPLDALVAAAGLATGIVCVNPAPATDLPIELLSRVDVLVPNRTELATLAGTEVPEDAAQASAAAQRLETSGAVVVTLGGEGALLVAEGRAQHIPAPRVEAVDPTGAGDAFCGALAQSLSRGAQLDTAVERAVVAGAIAATRPGAQAALPDSGEVDRLLAG